MYKFAGKKKWDEMAIKKAKYGFINLHNSYKNIIRGRNIATQSILLKSTKNVDLYGITLHKMTKKSDSGGIIDTKKILIKKNDTAWSLYKKGVLVSKNFKKKIKKLNLKKKNL